MNWGHAARLGTMSGALALSACMMPYDGGYAPAPPPAYSDLESPDSYAFIDRADSMWEAIGDAPPDYAFAFEGAEPWAWELQDGQRIVVEETGDGIQSYYFSPGDAGPFLAVRPGMSFGFEGETVAASAVLTWCRPASKYSDTSRTNWLRARTPSPCSCCERIPSSSAVRAPAAGSGSS